MVAYKVVTPEFENKVAFSMGRVVSGLMSSIFLIILISIIKNSVLPNIYWTETDGTNTTTVNILQQAPLVGTALDIAQIIVPLAILSWAFSLFDLVSGFM